MPALTFMSSSCCRFRSHAAFFWFTSASCGAICDLVPSRVICKPVLLGREPVLQIFNAAALLLHDQLGDEILLEQRFVRIELHLGLVQLGFDTRRRGFLGEQRALEVGLPVVVRGLRGLIRELGVLHGLLHVRVVENEDDRVGFHLRARTQDDVLDPSLGLRGNPADVFRSQDAGSADLPREVAALDGVDPDDRPIDRRRRRPQPRDAQRNASDDEHGDADVDDAANPLFPGLGWTSDINHNKC